MRKKLAAVTCTVVIAALVPSAALAGEVKGRPGTPGVPNSGSGDETAAPDNANSICAFSGLNDMVPGEGPIDFIAQSYGQDVRTGAISPHVFNPGDACQGGSN
jgi:hypothetical protein